MRVALFVGLACLVVACDSEQRPPIDTTPTGPRFSDAGVRYDQGVRPPPAPRPDGGPAEEEDAGPDAAEADLGPAPDAAEFEQVPFAVETRVGERHTPVGLENRVTCQVLDQQGAPIPGIATVAEVHPDNGFDRTEIGLVGRVARDYRIVCAAPSLGLRDPTPAEWTVQPGPAARVVTWLSDDDIEAGGTTEVTCEAYDAAGNLTADADFEVRIDPPPADVVRQENRFLFRTAGEFSVACALPGAASAPGVALQVRPGLPARIALALFPDRPIYRVGSVVEMVPSVTDRYDNPIPHAPLVFESDPPLPGFGQARFRCDPEGRYVLTARVDGPTFEDRELAASLEILVDFGGPGIVCEQPADGESIIRPEGGWTTITGKVADIAGVQRLRVDGEPVDLRPDGSWRADRPVRWGLNVHDVVADDGESENSTFCAYVASDRYLDEAVPLDDALLLRLGQGALDDGEPDRPLQSLTDVLRRVINSRGLRDTVHQALLAQNPVVPSECHVRVLGACLFRLGVEYRDLRIGGRNTLDFSIIQRGIRTRVDIRDFAITAQLQGTLNNRARISTDRITIDLSFNVGLGVNGRPDISLRQINEVSLARLDSDFSGWLTGAILELVFSAFEGLIRRTATDALRGFLEDNIDRVLTDLLGNVDIGELAQGFEVPSLTGGDPIRLVVTAGLNRLDFDNGRAVIGVRTKVEGPQRVAGRSPGVALPPGTGFVELPADRSVGAAVMLGILNQVMHRLWRAGFFEAEGGGLVENVGDGLPDEVDVSLRFAQAPVVSGVDGEATVRVFIPPLTASVRHEDFFVEPIRVRVAAVVDATVQLVGERDLVFAGLRVAELHLALGGVDVPDRARQVLEDTMRRILQNIVDRALNDGLPVLPLPDFVIPADLAQFDLPPGVGLGLRQPRLTGTEAHWRLDGNFGE